MKKEQKLELIGIILFLLSLYIGISLITYNGSKNPLLSTTGKEYPVIGQIGMVIAFGFKVAFGWSSFALPILLIIIAVKLFLSKENSLNSWYGLPIFMIAFSIILGIIKQLPSDGKLNHSYLYIVGYVGYFLVSILSKVVGKLGTIIFAALLFFVSVFAMTNFLFKRFVLNIKNRLFNILTVKKERKRKKENAKKERSREKRIKFKEKKIKQIKVKENKKEVPIIEPTINITDIKPPSFDILDKGSRGNLKTDASALEKIGEKLISTLKELGVDASLLTYIQGPTVTRYEFSIAPGQRINQITSLEKDIAYTLAKSPVRIIAPIPGKQAIGVEIPNENKKMISLREVLLSTNFLKKKSNLKFGIGCCIDGSYIIGGLDEMPHLLIAGSTGSGKSVMIKTIVNSLLMQFTPDYLRMLLIDPKRVEMTKYRKLPHLLTDIVVEPKAAAKKLAEIVTRMEFRYREMANYGLNHITKYNHYVEEHKKENPELRKFPYIIVIIDELADLMLVAKNEVETSIARLAQLARAVGIHLILATQRPSVDVITGVIKSNFPVRIAFRVAQKVDSRTIFDKNGAEALLGKGDLLYLPPGSSDLIRAQSPFSPDNETKKIVDYWNNLEGMEYEDWEEEYFTEGKTSNGEKKVKVDDDLFIDAVEALLTVNKVSTSYLQTVLSIGFNRASRLIYTMEEMDIISPKDRSGKRALLITREKWEEIKQTFY
jgi:S-DNA-T family DNA segregation ATPase FtsK/SpoIIIE